jgi:hypothetical protein
MRLIGKGRRTTPLTVVVAVFGAVLVSGGAYATAATVITGGQVKDNTLTGHDVRSRSLDGTDIRTGTLTADLFKKGALPRGPRGATGGRGGTGATGARGATGASGPRGPQGDPGPSGVASAHILTADGSSIDHSALVNCAPGEHAIGGGGDAGAGRTLSSSGPVSSGGKPVGWRVTATDGKPTAFAICAREPA